MITQDDVDYVLQLADDTLNRFLEDATNDADCKLNYIRSIAIFEQVREYLTTEGRIKR